ncbi:hypothetical protein LEP48_16470 [Isoptericola sp. NEAU-Y5]|uniref:Uncharacterized protein n=1 Tax=Isoptericola luteus TaxID=2879484 RepID=A0ABS7ZIS0_9MICO|nr:hypothetical protein [Isoptericola sp. NEAU-Y5]MCA5894929.1 hypothetical protein [Isoptericola sp. NEAU-Y5]
MTDHTRSYSPDLERLTDAADDSFSVRRAYGEPYEHQGHLVIPVAKVWGGIGTGAGGGAGTGSGLGSGQGTGSGTGSGAAGGSGRGTGDGGAGWSRSFSFRSKGAPAEGAEATTGGPDASDASTSSGGAVSSGGDAPSGGSPQGSAHGDASGDAKGEAKGEAQGEARAEIRGEGQGDGGGGGGGYGVRVKPLGVIVVSPEGARFQPVLDLNRVILGGQAVGVAIALALGWAIGRRRR